MADWEDVVRCAGIIQDKIYIQNKIDIYRDNWLYLIEEELARQFTPDTYKNLYWLITREQNVLKRVVNELSLVYIKPPVREVMVDGVPDENYTLATKDTNKNIALKAINKYTNLINHSVLQVSYRDNKLDYQVLNFNNVEVFTDADDWQRIVAVKYYVGLSLPVSSGSVGIKADNSAYWQTISSIGNIQSYRKAYVWTAATIDNSDRHIITNVNYKTLDAGKVYTIEPASNKKSELITAERDNVYRHTDGRPMLPFVIFDRISPVDQRFDFTSGEDLVDLTINVAILQVMLNQILKYQSFKQLAIIGADPAKLPRPLLVDPQQALALTSKRDGENVSVQVLDLQADAAALQKVIDNKIVSVLAGYGISPQNYTMSALPSSGYALAISNMGKLEARANQIEMYRIKERELFEIERAIWNYHNPSNPIDVKATFFVDFPEPSFPKTSQEKAAEAAYLKSYNVITDIDIIMSENPDITREEAEEIYRRNKAINAAVGVINLPPLMTREQNGQT